MIKNDLKIIYNKIVSLTKWFCSQREWLNCITIEFFCQGKNEKKIKVFLFLSTGFFQKEQGHFALFFLNKYKFIYMYKYIYTGTKWNKCPKVYTGYRLIAYNFLGFLLTVFMAEKTTIKNVIQFRCLCVVKLHNGNVRDFVR